MKLCRTLLAVIAILAAPAVCRAGVDIALKLEYSSYLQYDRVMAFVTLQNNTPRTVVLDSSNTNSFSGIDFVIRKDFKEKLEKINRLPFVEYQEIRPGGSVALMFDLGIWYDISAATRYDIVAEVHSAEGSAASQSVVADIVQGIILKSVTREVPLYPGRQRQYSLRYWTRNKQETLYLRVEEQENGIVYGVFPLGNLVRVYDPVLSVDLEGNVVVAHQSARDRITKTIFKSGEHSVNFIDQQYFHENGTPYSVKTEEDSKATPPAPGPVSGGKPAK